jgi:hypothetical protein
MHVVLVACRSLDNSLGARLLAGRALGGAKVGMLAGLDAFAVLFITSPHAVLLASEARTHDQRGAQ